MSRCFISYSHEKPDQDLAESLTKFLTDREHDVFIDKQMEVGTYWEMKIESEIRNSDFFIIFISGKSIKSPWVRQEAKIAHELSLNYPNNSLIILPIRIDFEGNLPYALGAYLDGIQFINWKKDINFATIEENLLKVIEKRSNLQVQAKPTESSALIKKSEELDYKNIILNIKNRIGGFQKRYLKFLYNENRFFSLTGITVNRPFTLEFKDLIIEHHLSPPKDKSFIPSNRPSEIWDYVYSYKPEHRAIVVLGRPGCGKSTMVQHIIFKLTQKGETFTKKSSLIPLPIKIKNHISRIANDNSEAKKLDELLGDEFYKLKPPQNWFSNILTKSGERCIVLIDGLDEIADAEMRRNVVIWIKKQIDVFKKVRFIITSRHYGYYENEIPSITLLEIEDFDYEQVKQFIRKWYLANEIATFGRNDQGIKQLSDEQSSDLNQRIDSSPALSKLAINPLLLIMIIMVHQFHARLPELRAALYEQIINLLLGRRPEKIIENVSISIIQKRSLLQKLAYHMMKRNLHAISIDEAIKKLKKPLEGFGLTKDDHYKSLLYSIKNENGLFVDSAPQKISFTHLTYQEYLAAQEIRHTKNENILQKNISNSWWKETILLYSADSNTTKLIEVCLASSEMKKLEKLKLAYDIFQEGRELSLEAREKVINTLIMLVESAIEKERHLAAELIFKLRIQQMGRSSDEVEVDRFFISKFEYQDFISRTDLKLDHWPSTQFAFGDSLTPIVGIRKSDALKYAGWLTKKAQDSGYRTTRFRLATWEESRKVIISEDMGDKNFSHLARTNLGTWIQDQNALCFLPENIPPEMLFKQYRRWGKFEIQDFNEALVDTLVSLSDSIQLLIRDLISGDINVDDYLLGTGLVHFSDELDKLIEQIHSLQKQFQLFYRRINSLGNITFQIDLSHIDNLDTELIRMKRLLTTPSDTKTLLNYIRNCFINTRSKLEWLKDELRDPAIVARNIKNDLNHLLEQQLEHFPDNFVDPDQQLNFLDNLKGLNLETTAIEAIINREIDKNFGKAKSELLTIAEALLYQNRKDLLPAVIKGFWAVFFIECRSRKENPLQAWEGIRLVREIRKPTL